PASYAHLCAPVPLHVHSCTGVPFAVPLPLTSRHFPSARTVPSLPRVHDWAALPLHGTICTRLPSCVWPHGTSRQNPLAMRIVPVPVGRPPGSPGCVVPDPLS